MPELELPFQASVTEVTGVGLGRGVPEGVGVGVGGTVGVGVGFGVGVGVPRLFTTLKVTAIELPATPCALSVL